MLHKNVGKVTEEERDEIKRLHSRKTGLESLFQNLISSNTIVNNQEMYEGLIRDYSETSERFQKWWDSTKNKYNWESADGGNWTVDFDTCDVILNYPG